MNSQTDSQKFMTGDKIARLGWIVALIMFSIALLLFIRILSTGSASFSAVREEILEVCTAPGTRQDAECAAELKKLYSLLEEVQAEREKIADEAADAAAAAEEAATPETPAVAPEAPVATTTPVL